MKKIRLLLAMVMLGLLASWLGPMSAMAAEACPPIRANDPRFANNPNCLPRTAATPQPTNQNTSPPATEVQPSTSAPAPGAEPTTNSEEWAGDAADSASELSKVAAERYGRGNANHAGFVQTFALTFAIGLLIFAVMLILLIARASKAGVSTDVRREMMETIPRVLLYVPLMLAVPGFVHIIQSLSHDLGEGFAAQSGASFGRFLTQASDGFMDVNLLSLLGKAFLALVLLIAFLFSLVVWLLEDMVAEYALWMLTALIPIAAAMSLWPSNRRMFWRIVGVVVGCALVPTVTRFAFWAMFQMQGDVLESGMSVMALIQAIVILMLSISMPVVLSFVMPAVMPNGAAASDGAAGNWQGHATSTGKQSKSALEQLGEGFKDGKGSRTKPEAAASQSGGSDASAAKASSAGSTGASTAGRAKVGASAAGASTGAASAGGASAGGASAAAGAASKAHPIAAAAVIAGSIALAAGNTIKGASRESALRMNTAAGGGYATDPDSSSPSRGVGQRPARRDSGSGPEAQSVSDDPTTQDDDYNGGPERIEPLSQRAPQMEGPEPSQKAPQIEGPEPSGSNFSRQPPPPPSGMTRIEPRTPRPPINRSAPPVRERPGGPPPMPTRTGRS